MAPPVITEVSFMEDQDNSSSVAGEETLHDGLSMVHRPVHYGPGEFVAAAALCGCWTVCLAPLDDE